MYAVCSECRILIRVQIAESSIFIMLRTRLTAIAWLVVAQAFIVMLLFHPSMNARPIIKQNFPDSSFFTIIEINNISNIYCAP